MADRLDVFVSSTNKDLVDYRQKVIETILRLDYHPVVQEALTPSDDNALQVCYDKVMRADVFIGIYAHRYGYCPNANVTYTTIDGQLWHGDGTTSITHWEYLWAREIGIPIRLFLVKDTAEWQAEWRDPEPQAGQLRAFKNRISTDHVVNFFDSPDELGQLVAVALARLPQTFQFRDKNLTLLGDRVRKNWIDNVLGRVIRENALELPLAWSVLPDQQTTLLPADKRLIDSYDESGRKLVIVGEPGAGKTTLALKLVARLLANRLYPVPVVFRLESWARSRPPQFEAWLIQELKARYDVDEVIARSWITARALTLVLDGLDEVPQPLQQDCVNAINQFQARAATDLILTCRTGEYLALETPLANLNGFLTIEDLQPHAVFAYVRSLGHEYADLEKLLQTTPNLLEFAQSPFKLRLLSKTYRQALGDEQFATAATQAQLETLLTNYVNDALHAGPYSSTSMRAWLIWLGRMLTANNQPLFNIQDLQAGVLQAGDRRLFWLISRLTVGSTVGIACGLYAGYRWGDGAGILIGIAASLVMGMLAGFSSHQRRGLLGGLLLDRDRIDRIMPLSAVQWSWTRALFGFGVGLIIMLILTAFLPPEAMRAFTDDPDARRNAGLIGGTAFGIVLAVFTGLTNAPVGRINLPNQGIRRSFYRSFISLPLALPVISSLVFGTATFGEPFGVLIALSAALVGGIVYGLPVLVAILILFLAIFLPATPIEEGLAGAAGVGLLWALSLYFGGLACIQHLTVRLLITLRGAAPFNYVRFLNFATSRDLMRRVGGSFMFSHAFIQDQIASTRSPH